MQKLFHRLKAAVWRELTSSQRFTGQRSRFEQSWLQIQDPVAVGDALLAAQLDAGETAVIMLARELVDVAVLIDERKARRIAEQVYGLRILGTGGLLLRAKVAGLVPGVQPLLTAMRKNGYHLSDRLVQAVCEAAGESFPGI
jgi:predicted nucleic acid-binding protein